MKKYIIIYNWTILACKNIDPVWYSADCKFPTQSATLIIMSLDNEKIHNYI